MNGKKITATAGTTQSITGTGDIRGFTLEEVASSPAVASVSVYDAIAGNAIADLMTTVDLPANGTKTVLFGSPLHFKLGVRVVVTGEVAGSLYVD